MSAHASEQHSDRKAAFTGLIVGAIALLIIVVTIVKLTNARYDRAEAAASSSATSTQAQ